MQQAPLEVLIPAIARNPHDVAAWMTLAILILLGAGFGLLLLLWRR